MDITKWSVLKFDWLYSCSQRWRSSIQSAQTRQGPVCGSDHEHLIAKFRLKLKKVGKTTRPFRYDLHQIPYNYTVEVTNRFKGLDLIRVPEELWTEICDSSDQNQHQEKEMQRGKMASWGASGGDGIPAELFQILKDDAVKLWHSICQQNWKTQQWSQD